MHQFNTLSKFKNIEHTITGRGEEDFFNKENLILANQVHEAGVKWVDANTKSPVPKTDALITKERGLWLGIETADCVPILIFDPKKKIIAAIHAGWRSTVYRIVPETIEKMKSFTDTLVVGIGPAICGQCFEVGEEVAKHFSEDVKEQISDDKWQVNLWEANKMQLLEMGVLEHNIEILDLCTHENKDSLYSYRRGDRDKRNGAFISLR